MGGDYTVDTLPEAPVVEALGGVVRILSHLEERGTSRVIARIRGAQDGRGEVDQDGSAGRTEGGG